MKLVATHSDPNTPSTFSSSSSTYTNLQAPFSINFPGAQANTNAPSVTVAMQFYSNNIYATAAPQTETLSNVISLSVMDNTKNQVNCATLNPPLTMNFEVTGNKGTPTCAWWNKQTSAWDTAGCTTVNVESGTQTTVNCECTHLTEFVITDVINNNSATGFFKKVYSNTPCLIIILSFLSNNCWICSSGQLSLLGSKKGTSL